MDLPGLVLVLLEDLALVLEIQRMLEEDLVLKFQVQMGDQEQIVDQIVAVQSAVA